MLVKTDIMVILTNHDFFVRYCYNTDLCRINRMWEKHLDKTIGRDATMADKEVEYDKWLHADFSQAEWDASAARQDTRDIWW